MLLETYLRNNTNIFYRHTEGKELSLIIVQLEACLINNTNSFYQHICIFVLLETHLRNNVKNFNQHSFG